LGRRTSIWQSRERIYKTEKGHKKAVSELNAKKDRRDTAVEIGQKNLDLAKQGEKNAANEASYKDAKRVTKGREATLTSLQQDLMKAKVQVAEVGKANEGKSKEGSVKEKGAKFSWNKAKATVESAVTARNEEINTKLATRQRLAGERHLKEKEQSDAHIAHMKGIAERAMKAISTAHSPKAFKEKLAEEKDEKKEYNAARATGEKIGKKGADEMERKAGDKDLFKRVQEKDLKARVWRQKAQAAANKATSAHRDKLAAMKRSAEATELKGKAVERAEKITTGIPGEKAAGIDKKPKEVIKPKEEEKDESEEKPDTKPKAEVKKPATKFASPYSKLEAKLDGKESSANAMHRRRRWVARRRAGGDDTNQAKPAATSDKKEVKKGFAASFWSSVRGIKSIGDAILKISSLPPTKKELVDSINYPATDGFWIGLNKNYQNNYVARFRGHINVPSSGDYQFFARCADGCMVYINGKVVVKNDGLKDNVEEQSGSVKLASGVADVVVDYFCATGKAGLIVEWKGPGLSRTFLSEKHVQAADHRELGESMTDGELSLMQQAALAHAGVSGQQEDDLVASIAHSHVVNLGSH